MYRGFGRTIVSMTSPGTQSAQRTHVDDFSSSFPQMLQRFARNQKRTASVGVKDLVPLLERELSELGGLVVGGIVNQDIDSAQLLCRLLDCRPDALFVRDVTTQSHGPSAEAPNVDHSMLGVARGGAKRDRHIRPRLSERQSHGPPQA